MLVAIEGVYSMDGDYPDLPRFIEVKQRHKAVLLVDEAHSAGTMGPHGRGIGEHFDVDPRRCRFVDGHAQQIVRLLRRLHRRQQGDGRISEVHRAGLRVQRGHAALERGGGAGLVAAAGRRAGAGGRLAENGRLFLTLARERGLNTGASQDSPVMPVILGNSIHSLQLSQALFARGINVQPIMHPAVEESAARLRFFITTCHTEEQIRETVAAVAEELQKIDPAHLDHRVTVKAVRQDHPGRISSGIFRTAVKLCPQRDFRNGGGRAVLSTRSSVPYNWARSSLRCPIPLLRERSPHVDSHTLTHRLVLPVDANHHGTLYAGSLLRIALEAAYATASRLIGDDANILLRRVLSLECYRPVPVGSMVEIRGTVLHLTRAYLVAGLIGSPLQGQSAPGWTA